MLSNEPCETQCGLADLVEEKGDIKNRKEEKREGEGKKMAGEFEYIVA